MAITDKRLGEIQAIPDSAVDTSDIPEAGAEFFDRATYKALPLKLGVHVEVATQQDGGPIVHVDGKFVIVALGQGGFYLLHGDEDCYCDGARQEGDEHNEFETLEAALAELKLAKEAMNP
jgi:hypothetical protein